jgi:hypothetical protein
MAVVDERSTRGFLAEAARVQGGAVTRAAVNKVIGEIVLPVIIPLYLARSWLLSRLVNPSIDSYRQGHKDQKSERPQPA